MYQGRMEIFGVEGSIPARSLTGYMEYAADTCKGSSSGPISLASDQTLCSFAPVLFRNEAICNVLVLRSEY